MPSSRLQALQDAAQSLKLYRRAEIADSATGQTLINDLYVDPLPDNQLIRTVLKPNTTFLIGRKGTGKSTVFQRLQSQLRQTNHQTSAYLDIKTIFESSQVDPQLLAQLQQKTSALPASSLESLLLYKTFLKTVVEEIKSELQKRVESSFLSKLREQFTGTMAELFRDLDSVLAQSDEARFLSAIGIVDATHTGTLVREAEATGGFSAGVKADASNPLTVDASATSKSGWSREDQRTSSDVLLRVFNIKDLIASLKSVLQRAGIRHLFILVDDFSELPPAAMRVVVDVLLAPLNNWSDEFIKFKVAAYPNRIYFGDIDKTKIDEVHLDLFRLYGSGDLSSMEDSAIDFTKRLVESRLLHYYGPEFPSLLERNLDDIWRELFYATMANPRILGYLLHFIAEAQSADADRIGISSIQKAAERYYNEKIAAYFEIGRFLHESFNERSSVFSLKELLESIVTRARELRSHDSEVMKKLHRQPLTSHFHVPVKYDSLFATLELNFFLTKYFEMSDRSGRKVSIYALNFGLCQKYSIRFGRPTGDRVFRLYFIERIFDYSTIIGAFLANNQEIACTGCSTAFSYDQIEALRLYGMRCPHCKEGVVRVTNLSRKYEDELRAVNSELLLPPTELGILKTLHSEGRPLRPAYIAGELDCSYQLVGKRSKGLEDRGLVRRGENDEGHRIITIEHTAEDAYFSNPANADLNLDEQPPIG